MKARRKKLASAIQIAVFLAIPAVAVAQEATTLDTVTVTGSRIKQTNAVTAQPVFVLDREKIAQTGVQSVGEILQQLTAILADYRCRDLITTAQQETGQFSSILRSGSNKDHTS